jgi:putative oxidoreductase
MKKLINLDFLPPSQDFGLLLLRVWLGGSLFYIHGLAKFMDFRGQLGQFHSMGIPTVLGSAAILAESLCALLVVIGLATRLSAAVICVTMAVAFYKVHHMVLIPHGNQVPGELAFLYLGGFLALVFAGAGKFSADAKVLR